MLQLFSHHLTSNTIAHEREDSEETKRIEETDERIGWRKKPDETLGASEMEQRDSRHLPLQFAVRSRRLVTPTPLSAYKDVERRNPRRPCLGTMGQAHNEMGRNDELRRF